MTYEEAIYYHKEKMNSIVKQNSLTTSRVLDECILEALEKQIPKKPRIKHDNRIPRKEYYCECGTWLIQPNEYTSHDKYCPQCGQAIDW